MVFHENRLLANDSNEISYLFFFRKFGKMSQNVSSAAIVIGVYTVFVNSYMKICKLPTCMYEVLSDMTRLHTFTYYPFFRGKLGP